MLWIHDGNVSLYPHDYRNGSDMVPGTVAIKLHSWSQINPLVTQKIPNVIKELISLQLRSIPRILVRSTIKMIFLLNFPAEWKLQFTMGKTTRRFSGGERMHSYDMFYDGRLRRRTGQNGRSQRLPFVQQFPQRYQLGQSERPSAECEQRLRQ